MPEISIITSAFNSEEFLDACAQSILSQSFENFEWILIDDGSNDNTSKIINKLADHDKRIRPVHQENKGLAGARNAALEMVEGKYFLYLDSDDFAHKNWLKIAHASINNNPELDFVSFDFYEVSEDASYIENTENQDIEDLEIYPHAWDNFSSEVPINRNNWNKIYRTQTLGHVRYLQAIKRGQDVNYGWRIRKDTKAFAEIKNKLAYYRINSGGVSRQPLNEKYFNSMFLIAKTTVEDYRNSSEKKLSVVLKEISKFLFKAFIQNNKNAANERLKTLADQYLKELIELNVFQPKYLRLIKRLKAYMYIKKKKLG